ncbi:MAG: hypothetical protein A6D91_04000 [Bacillaceae bacterium G1]|nr:sporulation membrane protein YtaF [Bacillota bacterium]OJF17270.1 MAG: hypothetical protein A6D91_04000 [Bacillaceae bacterium G1]
MALLSVFLLSLAVSLDSFTVGATYGLRHIRIPVRSVLVIAACSFGMVLAIMTVGGWLVGWMAPVWGKRIGALILCLIGLWSLWNVRRAVQEEREPLASVTPEQLPSALSTPSPNTHRRDDRRWRPLWEIQLFGYVIRVLKKPDMADMDRSGTISAAEALLLGLALSLDAMGAGIGAVMVGFSPWLTALCIGGFCCLFLLAGLRTGLRLADWKWMRQASFLPGVLLLLLGFSKLF